MNIFCDNLEHYTTEEEFTSTTALWSSVEALQISDQTQDGWKVEEFMELEQASISVETVASQQTLLQGVVESTWLQIHWVTFLIMQTLFLVVTMHQSMEEQYMWKFLILLHVPPIAFLILILILKLVVGECVSFKQLLLRDPILMVKIFLLPKHFFVFTCSHATTMHR